MSYLAIGAVTKAIAELLTRKLNKPPLLGTGATFRVSVLAPDDDRVDDADGINLFLYRVTESPFAKNMDWRGDRGNPTGMKRQPLALTLHYLLTAYAKKSTGSVQDDITAHQILGNAMAILHEYAILNDVHDSDFDADVDTQFAPELQESFEKIKINLAPLNMEEFSKIWTGLSKAYRLSVGYEVSLVQIAPLAPAKMPGPPALQPSVTVEAFALPLITAITPATGPAGSQVTLKGHGFTSRSSSTAVSVGDTTLAETDLIKLSEEEIVLTIPEAPSRGPSLRIAVSVGGRESVPVVFRVQPWIDVIQPLRGMTGLPLTIPFVLQTGMTAAIEVDGLPATTTLDFANNLIKAVVPAGIASNGPKPVVVVFGGAPTQRSNARFFEVLPHIQAVNVITSTAPAKTTITVTGARLDGKNVDVNYGSLLIKGGENTNPNQVAVEVPRLLPTSDPVSVIVDGRESNMLPPRLDRIVPAQAIVEDTVKLVGNSLSGQNVTVGFGATTVNIGAQAFASQIAVRVPAALAPGTVSVKVTVDGHDSNALSFEVMP